MSDGEPKLKKVPVCNLEHRIEIDGEEHCCDSRSCYYKCEVPGEEIPGVVLKKGYHICLYYDNRLNDLEAQRQRYAENVGKTDKNAD